MSGLPSGWAATKLGELIELKYGKSLPEKLRKPGAFRVYGSNGVVGHHKTYLTGAPAIVVGRKGSIGEVHFSAEPCFPIDTTYYVDRFESVSPHFAGHLLRTLPLRELNRATAIPGLNRDDAYNLPVYLPPLPEQRRIVAKIDSLSGKSNRARERLDRVPRLVEKYKQSVLAAAFQGQLTTHYRTKDTVRIDDALLVRLVREERDAQRQAKGLRTKGRNRSVPSKIDELAKLPRGWIWLTFDDCSWDMTVGHVGPMKDRYVDRGITFLRSLNIRPNRINTDKIVYIDEEFDRELRKSRLTAGDLVVVRTGEPGVAAVVPKELGAANCSDLVICRLTSRLNPHYAAYYMNSEYAKALVRGFQVGVAQQHFNVGAMSEMPVPLPSLKEQEEIVGCIDHAFSWIDRLAAEATSARKLIDHLDQAILAKAFRGELVRHDPADEPASVLLERIRAVRTAADASRRLKRKVRKSRAGMETDR